MANSVQRVAIYARVSTSNGQQDPEMQLRELREYAEHRGLTIVGEYIDRMTGSKDSRPSLNRLMADAGQRKFDAVLVWKLDRFGRSLRHLVNALAELEALGLSFISLRDNLDLSTPAGRLMFQIIGAMAEFERSLIQERVKAGLRNARAKGKKLGRPRADVDDAKVKALRASGTSWRAIAEKLGVGVGTVHRIAARSSKPRGRADGRLPKWRTDSPAEAADAGTPPESDCRSSSLQREPPGSVPAADICSLSRSGCCGSLRRFPPSPDKVPYPGGQLRRRRKRAGLHSHFRDHLLRRIHSQSRHFRESDHRALMLLPSEPAAASSEKSCY